MFSLKIKKTNLEEFNLQDVNLIVNPIKQGGPLKIISRLISYFYLKTHNFEFNKKNVNYKFLKEPCLIIMNHVYETDFKIAFRILGKGKFNICAARDAFLGREKVVQKLGCTSLLRFTNNPIFVKNAHDCIYKLKQSLLVYPEGEYSADGLSLGIPPTFGRFIKFLNVPVLFLRSYGTYAMQPMYNAVKNKNKISATLKEIISKKEIDEMTAEEIQRKVSKIFNDIDHNKDNKQLGIKITNKKRADHLDRILYKCPICGDEYNMVGKGVELTCKKCGASFTYNEDGSFTNKEGKIIFNSISSWTNYERNEIKKDIINNKFTLNFKTKIYAFKNYSALYDINEDGDVFVNKDGISLKYKNKEVFYDCANKYAVCATMNCLSLGPTLIIDADDVNYLLCPYIDNGDLFKIRIAFPLLFELNKR